MKKGCFLKSIIILTILVAAGLYIVQNHLEEFFSDLVVSGADEELSFINESPEKDSLRTLLKDYLQVKFTNTKELSDNDIDWLIDSVKFVVRDSIITREDLNKIKNLIEQKGYERSKKN
ncbi:MAG: hypothetical protein Q7S39_08950 [Ignavibacteria bacterium]|nr:hypothetical protein [Ignavibacteria bacterium]